MLRGDAGVDEVRTLVQDAYDAGVTGVPCFVLPTGYAIPGAQSVETLTRFIERARELEQASNRPNDQTKGEANERVTGHCGGSEARRVEFIACFPHNDLIEACAKVGIRPIMCRQERVGIAIADGFSRVTNGKRIGVFVCQQGPGAENAFPGVAQAFTDNVPLLMLPAGEATSRQGITPVFSSYDNYAHVTKWRAFVGDVQSHRADAAARVLSPAHRQGGAGADRDGSRRDGRRACRRPSNTHRCVGSRYAPDADSVKRAVDALLAAKRPVIVSRGKVCCSRSASDELVALAERLDMPGADDDARQELRSPSAIRCRSARRPSSKPPHMMHFLNEADVVFGIGTSFTRTLYGTNVPARKTTDPRDDQRRATSTRTTRSSTRSSVTRSSRCRRCARARCQRNVNRGPGARAEDATARKRAFIAKRGEASSRRTKCRSISTASSGT